MQPNVVNPVFAVIACGQTWEWANPGVVPERVGHDRVVRIDHIDLPSKAVFVEGRTTPLLPEMFVDGTYRVRDTGKGAGRAFYCVYRTGPALTVDRASAWAIVNGVQTIENRIWAPQRNLFGQRLWIHASDVIDQRMFNLVNTYSNVHPEEHDLVSMSIVGSVIVERVVDSGQPPWFSGPIGWVFASPIKVVVPMPYPGGVRPDRLWTPDFYRR